MQIDPIVFDLEHYDAVHPSNMPCTEQKEWDAFDQLHASVQATNTVHYAQPDEVQALIKLILEESDKENFEDHPLYSQAVELDDIEWNALVCEYEAAFANADAALVDPVK